MNKTRGIFWLLVFVCVATALLSDAFATSYNIQNLLRRTSLFAIISVGVAFVIITGGIDLSIGSVVGLVGILLAMFLVDYHLGILLSLVLVMLVSIGVGLLHGLLITRLGLQPFIVTLCGLMIYRGLASWIANDQTKGFGTAFEDNLRLLATGKPCSVAFVLLLVGVVLLSWGGLLLVRRRSGAGDRPRDALMWLVAGLTLSLVGSSRYWYGWEIHPGSETWRVLGAALTSWSVEVPPAGEILPQRLLGWFGWATVPLAGLVAVWALRRNLRGSALRLAVLAVSFLLLWLALRLRDQPDDWFWPSAAWAGRWRNTSVFTALALAMGALAWFAAHARRVVGPAVRLPIGAASGAAVMWLLGQVPLAGTLLPAPFFIMLGVAAVSAFFLNLTIYGRYLLALGRNEEAARYSGIRTQRLILMAYVICGGAAGLGGILMALDAGSIQASGHGNAYELYAIAAAVLGGCSLRGGEGTILGVIIGTAVMRVLYTSISLLGIPTNLEFAIIGTVILVGVVADEAIQRVGAKRRMGARARAAPPPVTAA